ncbi:MAG: hypothetical protein SGJ16_03470 [Nitrospirota bacterium]|nr:hypothetical protein [Nitrospirota bacterium]
MNLLSHSLLIVLLSVAVSGCGTSVVSSTPRQVIVESQTMDAHEAQRLADIECAKNSRYAKMTLEAGYWEWNYTFECVESQFGPDHNRGRQRVS